jgi:tetratricopeptide (TPR) repeat protein
MDITRKLGGAESNEMASDLNNRALILANLGRLDEARADWAEARRIYVARNGATHPMVGVVDGNLADALWHEARWAEAKTAADRAVDILEPSGDTNALAFALTARGGALLALGDNAGARRDLERALAQRSGPDADPYLRALVQVDLAIALFNTGDPEQARLMATAAATVARERGQAHLAEKADWVLAQLGPPTARPAAR